MVRAAAQKNTTEYPISDDVNESESVQAEQLYLRNAAPSTWQAFLNLKFLGSEYGCKLYHSKHLGPLYVQKAFYPEGPDCAHVYLLHPPGGIVSGDKIHVSVSLSESASVLVTTPGATRLYRARQDDNRSEPLPQKVVNTIEVKNNSVMEWLPAETIVFDGASIDLLTEIYLDENSCFCGWEIVSLGLPASDIKFTSGNFCQSLNVYINDDPVLLDRLDFSADSPYLHSKCGFQSKPIYGSFIIGPFTNMASDLNQSLLDALENKKGSENCCVTVLGKFVVVRYLGGCSEEARNLFIYVWEIARPLLVNRPAVKPRIWAT